MPIVAARMSVAAAVRAHSAVKGSRITMAIARSAVAMHAGRGIVGVAARVADRARVPDPTGVTAGDVPAAAVMAATATTPGVTTSAIVLSQCGRRAYQDRPQYAGRQKKAVSPSTHDCHLS